MSGKKIGGCDGFCSTVGLESSLGWCHAEKQNAPHHHLWTFPLWLIGLCQLAPTTSLQVHLLSDEETIEKPSAGMLVCAGWCSIHIMILLMKLSLHMYFARGLRIVGVSW